MEIFCSTIIPTIIRPTLSRAVCSVLDQAFNAADFEVIVVNDSGQPLLDSDWRHSERVRVIDTNRRERSVARNTGAAIARGKYLHFLDDDDCLLPGAMEAFWNLAQGSDSAWLYGSWRTVDNQGVMVEEFWPNLEGNIFALLIAGESLPLQASLFRTKEFFAVGGFDPTITACEDRDLGRRLALLSDLSSTPTLVAQIRIGEQESTTDWSKLAKNDRWGREKALREQNAFTRLRKSATSGYLHGRVSRALFASAMWNFHRGNGFIAISRAVSGVFFTGRHLVSASFWRGLGTKIK